MPPNNKYQNLNEERRRGRGSAWHNVSTNASKIYIDGVTVEDLLSIIRDLMLKHGSDKWKKLIDDLYRHIVNLQNPHKFTLEQLDQQVIDVLYKQWIDEGYYGSKQEFIDIFFQYVEIADLKDMNLVMEGTSTLYVPVVAVLAEYVKRHNESLEAHQEQFKNLMGTSDEFADVKFTPAFAVSRLCNLGLKNFYDHTSSSNDLNDYPLGSLESTEGFVLVQAYMNPATGTPNVNANPRHLLWHPVSGILTDQDAWTSRYIDLRVNKRYISLRYRDVTVSANTLSTITRAHGMTGPIINIGITFNKAFDCTLFYSDQKVGPLGVIPSSSPKPLVMDSLLRIPDMLKFPEDVSNSEYLTLGVAFFPGRHTDAQVRHLLTSYWPNP
jgi:hypothetical protein